MCIRDSVKIIIGGGDQAIGAIGVGVVNDDYISVALGTSGVVFANNSEYIHDKKGRLHSFCHASGRYHQMGVILSAASCLKWWAEEINKTSDYETLIKEAEKSEAKDLYFLPYLVGEMCIRDRSIAAISKPVTKKVVENIILDKEAEVIVVGAGGAGLAAGVSAYENGAKSVIILEKMPIIGGNTVRAVSYTHLRRLQTENNSK